MDNDLKARMKNIRLNHGLTQQQLAASLNTSRSTISNYESGLRNPDSGYLHKFCHYFNVSADYLLGFKRNSSIDSGNCDFSREELDNFSSILSDTELYSLLEYFLKEPKHKDLFLKIAHLIRQEKL